ncbi:copper chaperone PCu(A)C [Roseivivax sp. CAU 1753]
MFRTLTLGSALALSLSASVATAEIVVSDAYIRSAAPTAVTGAAFMAIENTGDAPMRLISAQSGIAERIELHTHIEDENGMMMMREIEGGIEIAPGETHMLQRGGDHVMFLGLTETLEQGETVAVTLGFEDGTSVALEVPVDRIRMPEHGGMRMQGKGGQMSGHGTMKMSN